MKKFITLAVMMTSLLSSSFALGLSVGVTGFLGSDIAENTATTEIANEVKNVTLDTNLNYGFGLYGNLAILNGLGVQVEANLTKGSTSINGLTEGTVSDYDTWILDVPVMLWDNFTFGPIAVGLGAGVNFSFDLASGDMSSLFSQAKASYSNDNYRTGFAGGANVKFYLGDNLGIVAKGLFIADFDPKTVELSVEDYASGETPSISYTRRSLYGAVGLEYKF